MSILISMIVLIMHCSKNYVSFSFTCITHFLAIMYFHVEQWKLHNAFLKCFMDGNDKI